jgi:hypothetical protein
MANPGGGAMSEAERKEQATQSRYSVRQVTDYQASWREGKRGEPGVFTLQLILDKGVAEYVLDVDADDLDVMLALLKRADHAMFDLDRKVLMFENLDVD